MIEQFDSGITNASIESRYGFIRTGGRFVYRNIAVLDAPPTLTDTYGYNTRELAKIIAENMQSSQNPYEL